MSLRIRVSVGEVLDKITILEIKSERISGDARRANVRRELDALQQAWNSSIYGAADVAGEMSALKAVNEALWEIEDRIREKEAQRDFGDAFIELARSVYKQNDRRATIKRTLNDRLGSDLTEEKSYEEYE